MSDLVLYLTWNQDAVQVQLDECCQGLSRLIQDQLFLTSMVHAMEEQKSFTIKDKSVCGVLLYVSVSWIQYDTTNVWSDGKSL